MAKRKTVPRISPDRYTYHVADSGESGMKYVGLVAEFPSLSWLASTSAAALRGIKEQVASVLLDMTTTKETPPAPRETQDRVNHPSHYTRGGIEAIDVIEAWQLNFHTGNALKYISRCGHKNGEDPMEALKKARWYIDREIVRRTKET